jgi:ribosome-binding factor A
MNQRSERVAELIHRQLSGIISFEMRDPRIKEITITNVTLTPDLQMAKVYFTWPGPEISRKEIRTILNRAGSFFRAKLTEKVELKYIPQIHFYYDDSQSAMQRMEDLFKEIKGGE